MPRFRRIAVFCGSALGARPSYRAQAEALGRLLAGRGTAVVYGGAKVGLMGALADAALAAGGEVHGAIPLSLVSREVAHDGLTEQYVVESMHARKTMMAHLSDGFIALPGGWGTLEETFEIVTWAQLGYHKKPVGLLNVDGYYDHLLAFCAHAVAEGLLAPENRELLVSADDAEALLDKMASWAKPT